MISEIEDLRLQQMTQEHETAATSEQAQALMNLNIKLQTSATKAQSKTIEMELKRLEAAQLAEQSRIITVSLTISALIVRHTSLTHTTRPTQTLQRYTSSFTVLPLKSISSSMP